MSQPAARSRSSTLADSTLGVEQVGGRQVDRDGQLTALAAAVKAGQLTQAQADAMTAGLEARITERVTSARRAGGHGGHGDGDGDGPGSGGLGRAATPTSPEAGPS